LRVLAINFASTHQAENPRGFSEVGENQQLLIAIVLVAQLLKYTKKKLHKNYRFCIFNHARKKEFHASIIRFG